MIITPAQAIYFLCKEFGPINSKPLLTLVEAKFGSELTAKGYIKLIEEGEITVYDDERIGIVIK